MNRNVVDRNVVDRNVADRNVDVAEDVLWV